MDVKTLNMPLYKAMSILSHIREEECEAIYETGDYESALHDWIDSTEWQPGDDIKVSCQVSPLWEYSGVNDYTPSAVKSEDAMSYSLLCEATGSTNFPYSPQQPVTEFSSTFSDIEADRIAGYLASTNVNFYSAKHVDPTHFTKIYGCRFGSLSVGNVLAIKKILNGTITGITTSTVAKANTLDDYSTLSIVRYVNAYYDNLGTQHYTGRYNNYIGSSTENRVNSIINSIFSLGNSSGYTSDIDFDMETNFYIFETNEECDYYLRTGDASKAIRRGSEKPAKDRLAKLYYRSKVIKRPINGGADTVETIGSSHIDITIQYATNDGTIISNPTKSIVGYVNTGNVPNDMTTHFGNINWVAKQGTKITEVVQVGPEGSWKPGTLPKFATTTGFYGPYIYDGYIYESSYDTNMLIFANQNDAVAYLQGNTSVKAIGGGRGKFNWNKNIGDQISYNDSPNFTGGGMSSCWVLDEAGLQDLAPVFTTGLTSREMVNPDDPNEGYLVNQTSATIRSLAMYGEPIDMVCDLFWLPFDPSEFYTGNYTAIQVGKTVIESIMPMTKVAIGAGSAIWATAVTSNPDLRKLPEILNDKLNAISENTNVTVQERGMQ